MNKTRFNFNLWCLIVNSLIVKLFIDFSGFLLYENNSGAVLSLLISVLIFLLLLLVLYVFRNYFAACMRARYIRNIVYVIFTGYLICHAIYYLYRLVNLLSNFPYTNMPYYFVLAVIIIAVLIIGIGDKPALFKLYGICVPLVILGLLIIILNGARHIDVYNMLPVFGNGIGVIVSSGIKNVFAYSEILLPIAYVILFKDKKNTKYSFSAVLFGLILYVCFFAVLFLALPYEYSTLLSSEPAENLSRFSALSRLNTRLDVMNIVIILISSILYLSAVIVIIKKLMSDLGFNKIKFKRTSAALLVIAVCIAPLCGCYDNRDVEDTAYAIAVGVDLSEETDELLFTFQFSNPLESGKNTDTTAVADESDTEEAEEGNKSVNNISVVAPTVFEGLENIKNYIGKSPSLSHLKLIVLSDALINKGEAFKLCSSFMEIMEVRPETKVCTADLAKEYLEAVNPTLEESTARYYELLFSEESATESLQIDLRTLLLKVSWAVDDVYMPVVTEQGFDGAVLFSGDYPVLTLSENDCRLLNIIFGKSSEFLYYTTEEGQSVKIKNRNKPKINSYINNSEIYGDVEIKVSEIKNIDSGNYENISSELSQRIEELLEKIYAHNCDILSVKKHALKYFKYEYEWKAFLDKSGGVTHINNITVNV